jgi:hypothetical protein
MTMQASTLVILEAAEFSPKQARALAQAIEGEIEGSDLVTVPVLNARLAEFRLDLAGIRLDLSELEKRMSNRMVAFGLTLAGLQTAAVYFMMLHLQR